MEADYMVLADAVAAADGKLYSHGAGWDNVLTREFPATLTAAVGILLRMPWGETNEDHFLDLDILDQDGHSMLATPVHGKVNVGRPPTLEPGSDQAFPLVISLNETKIERAGQYAVILKLDGKESKRATFRLAQMPQIMQAPHGSSSDTGR